MAPRERCASKAGPVGRLGFTVIIIDVVSLSCSQFAQNEVHLRSVGKRGPGAQGFGTNLNGSIPMKTNISLKRFRFVRRLISKPKLLGLTIVICAAFTAQSVNAGVSTYILTLTENSSTSLLLAYSGPGGTSSFSVLNTFPDNWTISVLSPTIVLNNFIYDFAEPEDVSGLIVNTVSHFTDFQNGNIFVQSDVLAGDRPSLLGPVPAGRLIGTDSQTEILLFFNDLSDAGGTVGSVPETGSAFWLLAFSSIALLGLRRLSFGRIA